MWTTIVHFIQMNLPFVIVMPYEAGVFIRLGKIRKDVQGGFYWKIPYLDEVKKIPKVEQVVDTPECAVTTKEGQTFVCSMSIHYCIGDAGLAICSVLDYDTSIQALTSSLLTSFAAETNTAQFTPPLIDLILHTSLQDEVANWGLTIIKVKLNQFAKARVIHLTSQYPIGSDNE